MDSKKSEDKKKQGSEKSTDKSGEEDAFENSPEDFNTVL